MTIRRMAKFALLAALALQVSAVWLIQSPRSHEIKGKEEIPPLPPGVTEIKFGDFFVNPVGDRGLALTHKLKDLDGRRVRILGYMARQEAAPTGAFLLTPFPIEIHDHDNELADDLPASTVHVIVPHLRGRSVPFTPQLLLLTGVLSLGNREEADGRISVVRLTVDPPLTST